MTEPERLHAARSARLVITSAALVLAATLSSAANTRALPASSISPALPASPSVTLDMPPEVRSWRYVILEQAEYEALAGRWRTYADAHPGSAVALVELARALRYAGGAPVSERNALVQRALELGPSCPEALNAMADTRLHSAEPLLEDATEALLLARRAIELAPAWPEPHFTAWSLCMVLGRHDEADGHLAAMLATGGIPGPVLDFGYNLLMSADPGGIVLTNGDNDTYPPLALQRVRGVRDDVAIVNLSLLNLEPYATGVWERALGEAAPFGAAEMRSLHARWKRGELRADVGGEPCTRSFECVVVRELLERVRDGRCRVPVYFALTVSSSRLEVCELSREIEGLAWRVLPDGRADGREEVTVDVSEPRLDLARTAHLFREVFRLDSATDLGYPWPQGCAVRRLMINYPAVLQHLAGRAAAQGDLETVRHALRTSLHMLDFHGRVETARGTAAYWREIEPDNRELERELARWLPPDAEERR